MTRLVAKGIVATVAVAALIAIQCASASAAQAAPGAASRATPSAPEPAIEVQVVKLRSDAGQVGCSLFGSAEGFPRDGSKVIRHIWAPIESHKSLCRFTGMPAGTYAVVIFHDENLNGKFDENALGMPLEGYGFSNDAASLFGPPSFKAASFSYDGRSRHLVINTRY